MDDIVERLKRLLIDDLNFSELQAEQIDIDTPLFGPTGLGLDSVDALEVVLEVERQFGVTIEDNAESREILSSLRSLAAHIQKVGATEA
ncbi:MAG: acyl carrier protein [Myxococcales bacterium]|nr:acyl carrier protein [Myxococcales bacterium]